VDINQTGFFSRNDLYQYYLRLNDKQLALRGLNRRDLYSAIALDINPAFPFGKINLKNQRMYLIGRNAQRQFYPKSLMTQKRTAGHDSVTFDLQQIAQLKKQKVQSKIRRVDQAYTRVVGVNFLGPYRLAEKYIKKVIHETPVPVGEKIKFGSGFIFSNAKSQRNALLLLGLTILCVWMIVSALMESWFDPLIVICIVPLGFIGVMGGTLWQDLPFARGAIAGTLLCVGVAVNNGILLMHEKQRYRKLGIRGLRSWLYVYRNKMRPVLITTLTAVGGMLPIIWMGHSEFWTQLATVTAWGLSVSTILLLLLIGTWEKTAIINKK
jgi:multidrug efflux pump subunit AcrB